MIVCQFGPDGDVKLFRSAPGSIAIDAKNIAVEGELRAKTVSVGGIPIHQYVMQMVEEILKKHKESGN